MDRKTKKAFVIALAVLSAFIISVIASSAVISIFGSRDSSAADKPDTTVSDVIDVKKEESEISKNSGISSLAKPVDKYDDSIAYEKISFVAVGDNIIHSSIYEDAKLLANGTNEEYVFLPMYDPIKDIIKNADISFVNQETLTAGESFGYSGYPMFNSPREASETLIDLGFDIVNIANNHMLDRGEKGLISTIEYWKSQDVTMIGGYEDKEDFENIRYYEYNGVKIALLSYTYGTNGLVLPASSKLIVPLYDYDTVDRQTKEARKNADLVFVSMHWGVEDNFTPDDYQQRLAKMMAQNGVDVVIGHHPHVIEKLEWLDRPDGKKTLVIYSLGNMLSTMLYSRNMLGGLVSFDIIKFPQGTPIIDNVKFTPIVTYYNMVRRGLKIYTLDDFTEELARKHGTHANDDNMSLSFLWNTVNKYIPEEFLERKGNADKDAA